MSTTYPSSAGPGSEEHKTDPMRSRGKRRFILLSGGALLLIAWVGGFVPQFRQRQMATADTKELAIPTVEVVSPTFTAPNSGLDLPAEVDPWQEAPIYARVNGYLKSWLVDIGAHVKKDQLLAEIDTPDLDQQLAKAQSQEVIAQKNLALAKDTHARYQEMCKQGVVSQRDADTQATSQATNQANADAHAANLRYLQQEVAFKRVTAPFAGIITARNVNVGDLITANNTSFAMFHVQQTDPLRVYFRVPQEEATNITVGQIFHVQVGAESAKKYPGKVISTSDAVSPDSRTMLVELQVDNSQNEILPGSYATIKVPTTVLGNILILPDNTLIFRGKSLQVAVVNANSVVQLQDIKVGRDFGIHSEVLSGVTESDKVIVNPSDSLTTGTTVRVASATSTASPTSGVPKK